MTNSIITPDSAAYTTNVSRLATTNVRFAKMSGGTSGSCWRRCSTTNDASATTPTTAPPTTSGSSTPRPGASTSAAVTPARPSAPSTDPQTSGRPPMVLSHDSGTYFLVSQITASPSGTLIRNASRHDHACTSSPPISGPIAPAIPPRPDHAPIALGRSSRTNDDWMIASAPGVSSAPPTPCSTRAATSISVFSATPHSIEDAPNHTTPSRKTRRRP